MPETTPEFGWPLPSDTDPVKDGAAAIRDLGNAIEDTLAVELADVVRSTDTSTIVKLTQAAYDALTPDPATLYVIVED